MDLSTCKKKLNHGKYYNIEKLNKDLTQIWENCRIYNQVGSLIVQQADAMEEHHKRYLKDHTVPLNVPQKRNRDDEEEENLLEGKIVLVEKIKNAQKGSLVKVFNYVKHNYRSAIEKLNEHYRIKIDKLDKTAFEHIQGILAGEDKKKLNE